MEQYFHNLERYTPMTAAQERHAAERILEARQTYWRRLLAYPPLVVPIVEEIRNAKPEHEGLAAVVDKARAAGEVLGGRPNQRQRDAAAPALEALALKMADADPSCEIADRLAADVDALAGGRPCSLEVRRPSPSSKTFARYVAAVHSSRTILGMARNAMVSANLRLVVKMANRYRRRVGMPLADLVQEGNLGLLTAVDRFDPRRGFRFSTYGSWWIRHAIGRAIADKSRTVRLPVHVGELQARMLKERARFTAEHGRAPSLMELADAVEVSIEKIERLDRAPTLRQTTQEDPEAGIRQDAVAALPDDDPLVDTRIDGVQLDDAIEEALEELRPLELDILRRRFGLDEVEEMTLREVGEVHGLSRERIRQLQNTALGKVRALLQDQGFETPAY